ncbi:hypothetical protein N181_28775 [Sinorhizobium fredii USDA 205]|nr:hypothetical protein N181_28775 [Sinorhizobium fredii USDA 205]GEC34903.1 hypothetical protein EFR01_50740 [Sinorhizobium fredii]GLS07403.1 hypothetical protein GCM10007864_10300 [Sinorhizobium fredii]
MPVGKGVDHLADDFVLQGEDIREVAVQAFGPKTAGAGGVDELRIDPTRAAALLTLPSMR